MQFTVYAGILCGDGASGVLHLTPPAPPPAPASENATCEEPPPPPPIIRYSIPNGDPGLVVNVPGSLNTWTVLPAIGDGDDGSYAVTIPPDAFAFGATGLGIWYLRITIPEPP